MNKYKCYIAVLLSCVFLLSACSGSPYPAGSTGSTDFPGTTEPTQFEATAPTASSADTQATEPVEESSSVATVPPATYEEVEVSIELVEQSDATEPTETEALHSSLYIEGLDVEDVIAYFNEVKRPGGTVRN